MRRRRVPIRVLPFLEFPAVLVGVHGQHGVHQRLGRLGLGTAAGQVWSLSSFEVSCQLFTNDLNQVSSVSVLMTSSTALGNEGLFELSRRPSLTRVVSSSTNKEPGRGQVKRPKFWSYLSKFHLTTTWFLCSFRE